MNLIKKTYSYALAWMFPIAIIGSIFCFYMIEYIAHEETDEFLTYEMERLIDYHQINNSLPDFSQVADVIEEDVFYLPTFKDTLLLELGDNEMVPYRELRFSILHKEKNFTIVLRHLLLGADDIFEGTIMIVLGIMFIIIITLLLMLKRINSRVWNPFFKTLKILNNHKIKNKIPVFDSGGIVEFESLNNSLTNLLDKIHKDYFNHKEFTENTSHELQTHLAIIRLNTEQLINQIDGKNEKDVALIQNIYKAVNALNQVQKSLILLSKISNEEFQLEEPVNIKEIVVESLETFQEISALRRLKTAVKLDDVVVTMDKGLAVILVNNLLKNAIKHNVENGYIAIALTQKSLIISNSGVAFKGDPKRLVERFEKGETGNMGIGLSIVKQICDRNSFGFSYLISIQAEHSVEILFKS